MHVANSMSNVVQCSRTLRKETVRLLVGRGPTTPDYPTVSFRSGRLPATPDHLRVTYIQFKNSPYISKNTVSIHVCVNITILRERNKLTIQMYQYKLIRPCIGSCEKAVTYGSTISAQKLTNARMGLPLIGMASRVPHGSQWIGAQTRMHARTHNTWFWD